MLCDWVLCSALILYFFAVEDGAYSGVWMIMTNMLAQPKEFLFFDKLNQYSSVHTFIK